MNDSTPAPTILVEHRSDDARLTRLAGAFLASYSSKNTRRGYRIDLYDWLTWCRAWDVDPLACRRTHVELWQRSLEDKQLAGATRARKLAVVRSFYHWCIDEEILQAANPASRVKRPTAEKNPQPAYSRVEMAQFLTATEQAGGYDHALVMLLYCNGLRIFEACGCDVDDLGQDRWHHTLKIHGKGAKVDVVPLPPPVMLAVTSAVGGREDGPLLLNRHGLRMNRNCAVRTLKRVARSAGVKYVPPHGLRRTAIQLMLAEGTSLREAQEFARHAEPTTTAIYDRRQRSLDEHPSYGMMKLVA
jgi:integrase/recombinase XerD